MVSTFKDVLPDHIRRAALAAFPACNWPWWHCYGNGKLASVDPSRIPEACKIALQQLALLCEPTSPTAFYDFDFYGAGMHLMPAGTNLGRHTDASHHAQKPWGRVSSLVYFLEDGDGGELLMDGERIYPQANLALAFPSDIPHEVLRTNRDRKTLSLFSWELDAGEKSSTSAQFEM